MMTNNIKALQSLSKMFLDKRFKINELVNTVKEKDDQIMLIRNHHEGKRNHRGIQKTLEHLKRNYFWLSMKKDITNYINNCEICQKAKYARSKPYFPFVENETLNKPFQIIHMDIFKFDGQDYLTILDKFSKLSQALPVRAKTSIEICNTLLQYFTFYGKPVQITSDNGSEFNNETVKELLKIHNIKIHFTTPIHHEGNAPVERFHLTLIEHLRILRTSLVLKKI